MSGLLGKADLEADTNTDIYTVPPGTLTTANINLCNRTDNTVTVSIALHDGVLTDADYLECDASIPAHGVLERTGLVMSAGETIITCASAAGVSVRVYGFEEDE